MIEPRIIDLPAALRATMHDLLVSGSPYATLAAVHRDPRTSDCLPWFRNFWALGGKTVFSGAEQVFRDPSLIAACTRTGTYQVIEPLTMMTNLNLPGPALEAHQDLPFFRGAYRREVPSWLLAPMGYSGLFDPWRIQVVSILTWFYGGQGGGLEYWPNGLDHPSHSTLGLPPDSALLADNERMFHRVAQTGLHEDFINGNSVPYDAKLEKTSRGWEVIDSDGHSMAHVDESKLRLSVLWKARCYVDQADADRENNPSECLSPGQIVETLTRDLRRRGIHVDPPCNLTDDSDWARAVRETYPAPRAKYGLTDEKP